MSLEMWSQVKKLEDGDSLNAKTLNAPIGQLGDRTVYLYNRLRSLTASDVMSAVILTDVKLSTDKGKAPNVGNAVYFDQKSQSFAAAKATMSLYDDFTAANSAFTIGILISRDGDRGNVLAYGKMNLNPGVPVDVSEMIESGEEFRPGRYYLSANEAGRLSAHPNGPLIYVCSIDGSVNDVSSTFVSGTAFVNPQFLDIGTSHVHRAAVLTARPAGTLSTQGYLPSSYNEEVPENSLSLRFGGTWTSGRKIAYKFWLSQQTVDWPDGPTLYWSEDGKGVFSTKIHAPDEEVVISNGLTARLSIPMSTPTNAYTGLADDQMAWDAMVFPDAGKGWLGHEVVAVATSDVEGFLVSVRGRFSAAPVQLNVAFPKTTLPLRMRSLSDGASFLYGENSYVFVKDVNAYQSENGEIPVPIGTCVADSALYLASALSRNETSGRFAVFETDQGAGATLLVMDGLPVAEQDTALPGVKETQTDFSVVGVANAKLVLFDGNGRVMSASPVVTGIRSYIWNDVGNDLSVMVYQSATGVSVVVPAGTVAMSSAVDYEPDALYDYVLGMDAQVANYWPPVPPKSAALIVNGVEMDNKALYPDNPTVSFGRDTIHWFEDASDRKPWPEKFVSRDEPIDPALDKTETLHWVRGFQCATGPVTSIQPKEGSPLKIYGYGTFDSANTGDLEIDADFDFRVEDGGLPGYRVPKRAVGGKLIAGPVVEKVIGGAGINVVSMAGCPQGQGTVIVALDDGAYRSQFSDIALENAEQAKIGMFPYIRLKGYASTITAPSAFTATMRVPTSLPDGTYSLRLQASVFGEVGFRGASRRTACVNLAYNILPDYSPSAGYKNLKTGLLKPDAERTISIPFGHQGDEGFEYDGFDPIVAITDDADMSDEDDVVQKVLGDAIPSVQEFIMQPVTPELRPGYLVGIRISRAVASGSGITPYTSPLGFINLSWSLVANA